MNTLSRVLAGLALGATAVGVLPATAHAADPNVVATDKGAVRGSTVDGLRTFDGIPYAAAPVGDLRFRSPQPATAWEGVRDAYAPGGACAQPAGLPVGVPTTNEDCLYLNVTAPARADDLPVIVWIHPADMMFGSGDIYGPGRLAQDAVVVTPNYRLGVMGFLTDPSLDSGSVNGSGSLGVEDQQAALRWVQRNIEAFGGDAGNVTIMGESGGGYGVCDQLASPKAAGLFDRAIIQSAPCGAGGGSRTRAAAIDDSEAVVEAALASEACAGLDTATCLRTVDAKTLVDAYGAWGSPRPVSGTPLLPLPVEDALRTGRFNRVPVLVGVNHDEANGMIGGMELAPGATPIPPEGYRAAVEQYFPTADPDLIMAKYPLSAYGNSAGLALSTALTDHDWALAAHDTATTLSAWTRTYMFELARQETPWFNGYPTKPSFPVWSQHMAELPYIFDMRVTPGVDFFEPLTAEQARLGERMIATWTRFAETGNPGWERVRAGDANVRSIKPGRWCETEFVRDHELAFWRSL